MSVWVFCLSRDNPNKAVELDARSFSGRHADFVLAHWSTEANAGRLVPATIPAYCWYLETWRALRRGSQPPRSNPKAT